MTEDNLDERLSQLKGALDTKKRDDAEAAKREQDKTDWSGLGLAYRMTAEFAAGALVGGLLGFGIDQVFSTTPWGLIVMLILGCAAGFYNVLRAAGKIPEPSGPGAGREDNRPDS